MALSHVDFRLMWWLRCFCSTSILQHWTEARLRLFIKGCETLLKVQKNAVSADVYLGKKFLPMAAELWKTSGRHDWCRRPLDKNKNMLITHKPFGKNHLISVSSHDDVPHNTVRNNTQCEVFLTKRLARDLLVQVAYCS